ncbi:MAG: universal stress protein [Desulfobacterales bacterium]|jgi:nucleotide-binding universal stress UspA family protein
MIKTILCATDFSEYFRFTIDWGIWLSRWFSARMLVFHAIPSTRDALYATEVSVTGRSIDADLEQTRQRLESLMAERRVHWEPLLAYGDSVENLIPLVSSRNIDLVVAASYGLSGLKRMLLGTVVERMARSLNCPLWVVRADRAKVPSQRGIRKIAVACDFAEESHRVLETAADLAEAFGAEACLVHAIEAPLDEAVIEPTTGPYEEVQQELQYRVQKRLQALFASAATTEAKTGTAVLQGHPGEEIPEYARRWDADLIVVGVRPQGKVKKFLRGSTTEALLRRAPCAVLAIPVANASVEKDAPNERRRP